MRSATLIGFFALALVLSAGFAAGVDALSSNCTTIMHCIAINDKKLALEVGNSFSDSVQTYLTASPSLQITSPSVPATISQAASLPVIPAGMERYYYNPITGQWHSNANFSISPMQDSQKLDLLDQALYEDIYIFGLEDDSSLSGYYVDIPLLSAPTTAPVAPSSSAADPISYRLVTFNKIPYTVGVNSAQKVVSAKNNSTNQMVADAETLKDFQDQVDFENSPSATTQAPSAQPTQKPADVPLEPAATMTTTPPKILDPVMAPFNPVISTSSPIAAIVQAEGANQVSALQATNNRDNISKVAFEVADTFNADRISKGFRPMKKNAKLDAIALAITKRDAQLSPMGELQFGWTGWNTRLDNGKTVREFFDSSFSGFFGSSIEKQGFMQFYFESTKESESYDKIVLSPMQFKGQEYLNPEYDLYGVAAVKGSLPGRIYVTVTFAKD